MDITKVAGVDLCTKCHASIAFSSYDVSLESHKVGRKKKSSSATASAEFKVLVDEIERVELMLKTLKARRAFLTRHFVVHQRRTRAIRSSHILRLPIELLSIIFSLACTSFQREEYKTALSISLVCSQWREIAISTPTLWTNIYVAPGDGIDVYRHYMARCASKPFSIKIEIPPRPTPDDDGDDVDPDYDWDVAAAGTSTGDSYAELLAEVFTTFPQWKAAELHMVLEDFAVLDHSSSSCLEDHGGPFLESLTLAIEHHESEWFHLSDRLPSFFYPAPLLSSLTNLDRVDCGEILWGGDGLPWKQLRHICTDQSNVSYLETFFRFPVENPPVLTLKGTPSSSLCKSPGGLCLYIDTLVLDSIAWSDGLIEFFETVDLFSMKTLTIVCPDPRTRSDHDDWRNLPSVLPRFFERHRTTIVNFSIIMQGRYDEHHPFMTAKPTLADSLAAAFSDSGRRTLMFLEKLQVIEAEYGPPLLSEQLVKNLFGRFGLPRMTLVCAEDRQPGYGLITRVLSGDLVDDIPSLTLGIRNGGTLHTEYLYFMQHLRENGVQATLW